MFSLTKRAFIFNIFMFFLYIDFVAASVMSDLLWAPGTESSAEE